MDELYPSDFVPFFRAVRSFEPFRWQVDLVERLCDGTGPPDVIDVPTGFGKTAVIDCWAFALGVHGLRQVRRLPLRLFLVVDRRLIVDSAYEAALSLREHLVDEVTASGPVGQVARALHAMHGDETQPPLQAVRMRGGVTWASRWLPRPDQPAVVVGTVDQFGSRMLFRGYGVSARMRPIDAALAATDSWLVVDEAHIARPVLKTAGQVRAYQSLHKDVGIRHLVVTAMSATTDAGGRDVFRADLDAQASDPDLQESSAAARQRIGASKPVILADLTSLTASRRKSWRDQSTRLGKAMAELARAIAAPHAVVGVVANTISTARAAHTHLTEHGAAAVLLIGRVREHERTQILENWLSTIRVNASSRAEGQLFVVATQTIEVGANIDLDALVTEAAPLSSLIQRFGRVNRIGEREPNTSLIVHAGFAHDEDRIYGEATRETWAYLSTSGQSFEVADATKVGEWPDPTLDFGLRSATQQRAAAPDGVNPPTDFVPTAIGAHFEQWAATQPAPFPDQPVGPFLHGVGRVTPEVEVAWRAAPEDLDIEGWAGLLRSLRPLAWEFVTVPVWELEGLLAAAPAEIPTADLEGTLAPDVEGEFLVGETVVGVVYTASDEDLRAVRSARDVRPGDRVVLDSRIGGHDRWGWTGARALDSDLPVPDVADLAPGRSGRVVRLQEASLSTLVPNEQRARVGEAFTPLRALSADTGTEVVGAAVTEVREALRVLDLPEPILDVLRAPKTSVRHGPYGPLKSVLLVNEEADRGLLEVSDSDTESSSGGTRPVSLEAHQEAVQAMAHRFAENLGLPGPIRETISLAGRLHDLGKTDPRFQVMLHDGDELAALAAESPLAKSGRTSADPFARYARTLSRLPVGYRHEAVSGDLVRAWVETVSPPDGVDVDLLLHLIVSHHGNARPLMPAVHDTSPPATRAEVLGHIVEVGGGHHVDWSQPAQFEELNDQYGWWAIALTEAIVRLADMRCSEVGS